MKGGRPRGWVLYDATCGICSRWVPFWAPSLAKVDLAIAPLQSDWVRERLRLSEAVLSSDLRLLLADGRHLAGADVYRYAMRRIWWAWPLYWLSVLPGLRLAFDTGYRRFADSRHRLSHSCGLRGSADRPA